ncbi:TIGR02300 family protein [Terrihabitans soli]|uniref:TIGR02300 family protein n=1 Tax=Terrihabitans soli TaxID=708113 RepID=A0A6S6QXX4_9HYPH|nr:TIGR02300 family protein [Terrihabitans soli]BCJ92132.1 TIGR02300 family protein [Terrihabitans soli]
MAKAELGTKRVCPTTGRKFYDLNKDPIISPYTGMVVPVAPVVASRASRAEPKAAVPVPAEEVVAEEEVEVISLDEADEEETTTGKKEAADDIDVVDEEIPDADDDDDTFLEEDEDDEVDAAELIDGELPGEEEA